MEFSEYDKMALSLDPFKGDYKTLEKEEWIVVEKVHGANFGCYTNGKECKFARRRDFLKENEGFYNYKKADFMKDFPDKALQIYHRVQEWVSDKEVGQVILFGEIFGGLYNHPSVPKNKMKPVQQEIQYCPHVELICYDIAYNLKDQDGALGKAEFLDYSKSMDLFEETNIYHAKPLLTGSLNEAMNFPIEFDSKVPAQLGLPPLPKGTNKAEGVVIKPLKNLAVRTAFGEEQRVILKRKIPEFDETRNQKGSKKKAAVVDHALRPDKALIPIMLQYITENRMVSAVSKIGPPETEDLKKAVEEEFMEDVITDMTTDETNNTLWESCSEKQKEVVVRCLKGKTGALLSKYIDKML